MNDLAPSSRRTAAVLRAARVHGGWTLTSFAARAAVSRDVLRRWEAGEELPPRDVRERLFVLLLPLPSELARDLAIGLELPSRIPPSRSPATLPPWWNALVAGAAARAGVRAVDAHDIVATVVAGIAAAGVELGTIAALMAGDAPRGD